MKTKRPPSMVFPILGMLAFFPGGVMHMFALGEATRLASDWVYLSTPLLLIGAASFAWLLHGRMGTAGLGVGAVMSVVGLGVLMFNLNARVTERARWQESSFQLTDTTRFCHGDIKPNPRALPYVEGGKNPTVFNSTNGRMYEKNLDAFEPEEYQIEKAALVACLSDKSVLVETCNGYTGGGVAERSRVDVALKVFSIKTGSVVFEKSFEGKPPRACASTEQFYGKSLRVGISGERPEVDVVAELGPVLKP